MNLIKHPSVVLITGKRRSGKSCLGYHLLEKIHKKRNIPTYVVSLPKEKHHLLPNFITPVDNVEELPEDCISLIDESSLKHHAHLWQQKETIVMDRMLSVSGQKKQTFIFISHTMRKFAVALLLEIDILLCKEPSLFHSKLERSEVRKLVEEVTREFKKLPKDHVKKSVYVFSEEYVGFIKNPLPSFFTPELSEAFAGIDINGEQQEEEITDNVFPNRIDGGLKIWFKTSNIDEVLNIIVLNSGERLCKESVFITRGKAHLDFDLIYIGNGKYGLSSKRFNLERQIQKLKEKHISFILDLDTGIVDDELYPISREQLQFNVDNNVNNSKKDELEEFAKKIKL